MNRTVVEQRGWVRWRMAAGTAAAELYQALLHRLPATAVALFRDRRAVRWTVTVALAAFATLAVVAATSESTLMVVDGAVQDAVISSRRSWLDVAMVWLTFLGTRWVIGAAAFGMVVWTAVTGRGRLAVVVLLAAIALNPVFEVGFKELIGRARPDVARLLPGNGPSFPSGHVLASVGFYGSAALVVWESVRRHWVRLAALVAAAAMILTVAASRVYLDVHWTTDVVAGLLLGAALVALTHQAYLRLTHSRHQAASLDGPLAVGVE